MSARTAKRRREDVEDSSDLEDDAYSVSDKEFSVSSSSPSPSSSSSSSSSEKKKRKKKGKKPYKKAKKSSKKSKKENKSSNEKNDSCTKRAQNPEDVIRRYKQVLKSFKIMRNVGKACEACGIDRLTINNNAPIAEVALAEPDEYSELPLCSRCLFLFSSRGPASLASFLLSIV